LLVFSIILVSSLFSAFVSCYHTFFICSIYGKLLVSYLDRILPKLVIHVPL
jgi:hypothetical protein